MLDSGFYNMDCMEGMITIDNTEELRKALYNYLSKMGVYTCHEVTLPYCDKRFHRYGRVDMLTYQKNFREKQGTFRFYELKISKSDFHSKNGHNFLGNYNYYVFPDKTLYEAVKFEIPDFVGCLVPQYQTTYKSDIHEIGDWIFECIKKPKRKDLACSYDELIHNLITALSRECCKLNVGRYKAR